jgi:hypothetical protein
LQAIPLDFLICDNNSTNLDIHGILFDHTNMMSNKGDGMVELCESARRGLAGALHEVGKDMRLRMGGVRRTAG